MSKYYNAKRTRNLYNPEASGPFRLSRSKIDLFVKCPRCFYIDRRLGIGQPPSMPFALNSAVDALLKKEFDIHRAAKTQHPLMKAYGIDAVPLADERMDVWRDALGGGVQYFHEPTNLFITGGIDDVWVSPAGELSVVDYKATAKSQEVTLDADWQMGYKRQVEIYQWLFRRNGFKVSNTAYFVYCNGDADKEAFDGKLEFRIKIIPYDGNDYWVEKTPLDVHKCLVGDSIPDPGDECDYCDYRKAVSKLKEEF